MRVLVLASLTLLLCGTGGTQVSDSPTCPKVSVIGPAGPTVPGDSMTLTANVETEGSEKLKYQWTVSSGKITGGQGTPAIVVQTTRELAGTRLFATVEIDGLSAGCPKTHSSEPAEVFGHRDPPVIAYAESYSWRAIKAELDRASPDFLRYPTHYLYIITYVPNGREKASAKLQRERLIKNYLMSRYKLDKSKLVFVSGGQSQRFSFRMYRVPEPPPNN